MFVCIFYLFMCASLYIFQTQDCNWRKFKSSVKRRRRRELSGDKETDSFNDQQAIEDEDELNEVDEADFNEDLTMPQKTISTNNTNSLSENISLFQAIHVLQSEADGLGLRDDTTAGII